MSKLMVVRRKFTLFKRKRWMEIRHSQAELACSSI
jgi:hypothetical protein